MVPGSGVDPSAILGGGMLEARRAENRSRRAESGSEALGEGAASPLPTSYRVLGSDVSSPSGVQPRPPNDFAAFITGQDGLSWRLMVSTLLVLGCQFC